MSIMDKRFPFAPLWVNYVYQLAEWLDHYVDSITRRRYSFLDKHCRCVQCEDRRARGIQK